MEAEDLFFDASSFVLQSKDSIGKGTFGTVYIAESVEDKEQYAAKLINIDEDFDGLDQMLLLRECLILNKIDHPAIVKFLGVNFRSFQSAFVFQPTIITEYLKKGSLRAIFTNERRGQAEKNWTTTKKYISLVGIASAMQYLHAHNIIHRDLKSDNVLMDDDLYPRICDFGLSRCFAESFTNSLNLAMTSKIGTPLYMAPELLRGDEEYSASVDVYAYGILAYEIISEKFPYFEMRKTNFIDKILEGYRPRRMPVIPDKMWDLLCKCWCGTPSERPSFEYIFKELSTNDEYLPDDVDLKEYNDYVAVLNESQEELEKMKEEQQRKKGLENEVKELKELVARYKAESESITEAITIRDRQNKESTAKLKDKIKELKATVSKQERENAKLTEASLLRDKQNRETIAKLEDENRELKELLSRYKQENDEHVESSALKNRQNEKSIAFLEDKIKELKESLSKIKQEKARLVESSSLHEKQNEESAAILERELKIGDQKDAIHQSDANFYLGFESIFGPEKYRSMKDALKYLKKSSESGNCYSSFILGLLYETGENVEQDTETSFSYYELSARQGYSKGLHRIGVCYANGRGVTLSSSKAFEYYQRAAELNDASAIINMGVCYENGHGVGRSYSKAIECYQKAADLGNPNGFVNLGTVYAYGKGVTPNIEKAIEYFQKAVDLGDTNGLLSLGFLYESGRIRPDYAKTFEYYKKAAELGSAAAYKNLGILYEQGKGVEKDFQKAIEYYQKAVELGHKKAEENLKNLQKRMK